jgi:hypothetical protein
VSAELVALKRERKALEGRLEGLLARQANGPSEQQHALRTCLDALQGAGDTEKARQQIKMLLAGLVEKIGVYIAAKGYRRRACFVVVKYRTGLFRRIVIAPDGTAVTVADGTPGLDVPLPEGWP